MDTDWRDILYRTYVSSGQGGAGANAMFAPQKAKYHALIARHVPKDRTIRLLDLGCGAGALLFFLKAQGYRQVRGVDLSPEMIALAHQAGVDEAELGNVFDCLKATADGSLDVVFAMDILEHLDRAALFDLCHEVIRVLSPKGRFIVHVPNAGGVFGNVIRYGDLTHELAFTETSMRQLMRATGFGAVRCYEDRPLPHGLKSAVRAGLWALLSFPLRLLYIAETGRPRPILSQNMTAVADCAVGDGGVDLSLAAKNKA